MRIRHVELRDHEASIEDIEILYEDTTLHGDDYIPIDPRLRCLSPATRAIITARYDGSVDEAALVAQYRANLYRWEKLPAWCQELVGHIKNIQRPAEGVQ